MFLYLFTPYNKLHYVGGCIAVIAESLEQAQKIVEERWRKDAYSKDQDYPHLYASQKDVPGNMRTIGRSLYEGGKSNWKVPEFAWAVAAQFPVENETARIVLVNYMEK
jgi:uncharacterized protein (UPF0128 family)